MLNLNEVYHGFKVLRYEYIDEIASHAYIMEHEKSGAKLLYLGNDDDNKVFNIAFRTPPADDSGIPHILEHSSLCGSRKYHLKEPFVDLVKGSMNTFLNAMTYPDKTVYPVASCNDKDFHNLMDVYLDAVFYPLIYQNPYTLRQEGWHYEIENPEGDLSYNGVVYNEMKGVYSSPDAYLERAALRTLFPDNCYHYESGGYPEAIPTLTQEKFLNFHKTYYSPENSYIVLYGDMDINATLEHIDSEYLSNFTRTDALDFTVKVQAPSLKTQEVVETYAVDTEEDLRGKTYHELSIVCSNKATDPLTTEALGIIEGVLLDTESSPLRRALLDAHVGTSVSGSFTSDLLQPIFSIKISGSEMDQRDKFISTVYKTLQDITVNGLDKNLLEAALNSLEFKLRESDFGPYPKGLMYSLGIFGVWLYDGDPFKSLRYEKDLAFLREGLNNNYYESLIEQYLLDNTHKVIVSMLPDATKGEKEAQKESQKLAALKASMSKEELERYAFECNELHRLQAEPDSEEARASIPVLKRSDIRREIRKLDKEITRLGDSNVLYMNAKTNKIVYASMLFDITGISAELLPYAFMFVDVLGKFDTKCYSYQDIATNCIKYTGGLSFNLSASSKVDDADVYKIYFKIKGKCLEKNLPKMLELLQNIGSETVFDNKARLKELLEDIKSDWDDNFFSRGQNIAVARLYSYHSRAARVNELDYFSYYTLLKKLVENFDDEAEKIIGKLKEILHICFSKRKFTLAYSCDETAKENVREALLAYLNALPLVEGKDEPELLPAPGKDEGITTPGKVQYVVMGGDFAKLGYAYHGAMRVLEKILSYEYLWTKIRIQGGAYGASARFNTNGLMVLTSYRDPQLSKTVDAYKELADWLENVDIPERELNKYIIGTMSSVDAPLTTTMKLDDLVNSYIKDITQEMQQKSRSEILDVTVEDLRALAPIIRDTLANGSICVVGGKQVIEGNKEIFEQVVSS
ncbi:MAG: insulinase family protein [Phascolarctobacterium sp.]|nr:insulinase family protein [Phascolarctobacterium sp.]